MATILSANNFAVCAWPAKAEITKINTINILFMLQFLFPNMIEFGLMIKSPDLKFS
jgi:hypothetical protein